VDKVSGALAGQGFGADSGQARSTPMFRNLSTKSSDPPVFLHRIPPPKESMKVLRESPLVDEDTGSGAVRHSSWVIGVHSVVVR
jgi:hypothetical protein